MSYQEDGRCPSRSRTVENPDERSLAREGSGKLMRFKRIGKAGAAGDTINVSSIENPRPKTMALDTGLHV